MKQQRILIAAVLAVWCMNGCAEKYSGQAAAETAAAVVSIEQEEQSEIVIDQENVVEETAETAPAESVHLLFSGDVLLSNYVMNAYENAGGIHGVLDDGYRSLIDDADFFFVNEEFPFSDRGTQAPDKQYTFRLAPEKVSILKEMGVDGVSLANNHALDFGIDALLDTCDTLDEAGIMRTGAGADLDEAKQAAEVEIQGKKIAVIGATRVIPTAEWATHGDAPGMLATYDPAILLKEIEALDKTHDYVIVFVHWGIERSERPEDYQRNMGRQYIDAGADLVVGAHPHVLQGIEYYKGVPIVYSLGNFVFGSSIPETMLLEVELPADSERENVQTEGSDSAAESVLLKVHPGTSNSGYTRMLDDSQEKEKFYNYLESISYGVTFEDGNVTPQP